jgi:hypothetical protein
MKFTRSFCRDAVMADLVAEEELRCRGRHRHRRSGEKGVFCRRRIVGAISVACAELKRSIPQSLFN